MKTYCGETYCKLRRFYALLGIQRARGNTADEVRFTINVNVVPKDEWDRHRVEQAMQEGHPWWPDEPKANVVYTPDWWVRIGTLIDGNDRWWTLTGDPDVLKSVSVEVKEAVVRWAYPQILRRISAMAATQPTEGRADRENER